MNQPLAELLRKNIIFVQGKGGVGKSTLARSVAELLAARKEKTLLVVIEDPKLPPGKTEKLGPNLERVNCEPATAFEEYAGLKIGSTILAKLFTGNKLMRYLIQASPGIKELTIMGKIWYERNRYAHVVVDMPATGHGITLFHAIANWRKLFAGSPLEKETKAMTETFSNPAEVGHLIVALPEEMPMVEALELESNLVRIHSATQPVFLMNRRFPSEGSRAVDPSEETKPFADTLEQHLEFRLGMERRNEALWTAKKSVTVPYFAGATPEKNSALIQAHLASLTSAERAR